MLLYILTVFISVTNHTTQERNLRTKTNTDAFYVRGLFTDFHFIPVGGMICKLDDDSCYDMLCDLLKLHDLAFVAFIPSSVYLNCSNIQSWRNASMITLGLELT